MTNVRRLAFGIALGAGIAAAAALGIAMRAQSQDPSDPCAYQPIDIDKYGGAPFRDAPEIRSDDGTLRATLTVQYGENRIAGCDVRLRSYNGRLVGPTLRAKPGDTLLIRLDNTLEPEPGPMPDDHNVPHGFNVTNLHTHGLHVSPVGNSDNVFLRVEPQEGFDFEIRIPADHPPGTFWYHAHVHGSTALQVSSGMAGALIVEGGLDDILSLEDVTERILLFQQIVYDASGEIESYELFGPGEWGKSHRHTLINGQLVPEIHMRPGEVQRWRMIHGGVRETLQPVLKVLGPAGAGPSLATLGSAELAELRDRILLHEVAVDGLALGRMDSWDVVELEPGYRRDVLVKAPIVSEPTTLLLVDSPLFAEQALLLEPEPERILAMVRVEGEAADMPLPGPEELAGLAPFEPVSDDELDPEQAQRVEFAIGPRVCPEGEPCRPCQTGEAGCALRFMINDRPFGHGPPRRLELGTAAEWTLSSQVANHPYHIHVNPFQHTRIGSDGREQVVWRDTLLVRQGNAPVKIRTRYQRYIGRFVIHCHILDHEDQGMMEAVEVVN